MKGKRGSCSKYNHACQLRCTSAGSWCSVVLRAFLYACCRLLLLLSTEAVGRCCDEDGAVLGTSCVRAKVEREGGGNIKCESVGETETEREERERQREKEP